jgi:hypothetical protein
MMMVTIIIIVRLHPCRVRRPVHRPVRRPVRRPVHRPVRRRRRRLPEFVVRLEGEKLRPIGIFKGVRGDLAVRGA